MNQRNHAFKARVNEEKKTNYLYVVNQRRKEVYELLDKNFWKKNK